MTDRHNNDASVRSGDLLDDRYELQEVLGHGGISTVYKALDTHETTTSGKAHFVTVKVIKKQYRSKDAWMLDLSQASQTCQSLDHPSIAKTERFHWDGATAYMVMEYLSGESLNKKLSTGRMPVRQALRVVNEIGRALAYAHARGVYHNDLKPANVFLTDSGEVKVIDFNVAHTLRQTAKDEKDAPHFGPDDYSVSTPSYASPELLELRKPDPRDDVYALACIAYELLTGRHPFGRVRATGARDNGLELKPSTVFTKKQWSCLRKALALNREERTPTVTGFLTGLNTSANWPRRLSVTAGVMVCTVAVGLFYGRSQVPWLGGSTERETTVAPNLSQSSGMNQLVTSRESDSQPRAVAELVTEVQVPTDVQAIPEQVDQSFDVSRFTDDQQPTNERQARILERSSMQDDKNSSAEMEMGSDVPATEEPALVESLVAAGTSPIVDDKDSPAEFETGFDLPAKEEPTPAKPLVAADTSPIVDDKDSPPEMETDSDVPTKDEPTSAKPLVVAEKSPAVGDKDPPAEMETDSDIPTKDKPTAAKPLVVGGTFPSDLPEKRASQTVEIASITELQPKPITKKGSQGSEKNQSQSTSDLSPKAKVPHAKTKPQNRDKGLPKREVTKDTRVAKRKIAKDKAIRIVNVKHELIANRESPVAAIQARVLGPVSEATVSLDSGNGFVAHKLYDDGTHGDRVSGDREFYAAITLGNNRRDLRYYITASTVRGASVSNPIGAEKAAYRIELPRRMSSAAVVINEFMAANDQTIADSQGGYDDWIELYNPTRETIDLSGLYLSDNPKKPKLWRFPDGTRIGARSYLVVWADRSSSYTNMKSQPPELHTNFKLSRRGEQILLVDSDEQGNAIIDRVTFGRQREDRSMARYPNGSGAFGKTPAPTPGRRNKRPR